MKRFFLLPLCIAALSACSDDETAEQKPAVIGDVQFAAAIDPAEAGTRVVEQGPVTSWETGDRIGITAMIDGTPHVENIPYTLSDATTFSMLTPVAEAIRWNESITGRRTFFAYYPYDQTNAGGLLNRAVVRFSVPAEQHVSEGANTTLPFLIGEASTSAAQQQPVALRFRNFAPVLELRFEPLEETSIATIEVAPAEGSALTGWMAGEGTTDNLGNVTLTEQSDRLTVVCDGDGLPLDKARSVRIPLGRFITGTGGLSLRAVTTDERVFSETLFAGEPFTSYVTDDKGAFAAAKYIPHTMEMEVISDETREVYFEDDFAWISSSGRWDNLTGGGWPTVTAATSATGKANYFTLDLLDDFATIGYSTLGTRTDVQARYEGYVCLGISSRRAALVTPALEEIGAEPVDLLVSFYGANYATATMTPDTKPLVISVDGPGTIGDTDAAGTEVTLTNSFRWRKYWIIVKGATSETRIVFGTADATAGARILIDNILIGKAVKGAVAGSRDVPSTAEPEIRLPDGNRTDIANLAGAEASLIIQATTSWSAACEADWLTVSPPSEGLGTGIAYGLTFRALTQNLTGQPRTATVTVSSGDQTLATLTVTQTHDIPEVVYFEDDFSWTAGSGSSGGIFTGFPNVAPGTTLGTNGTIIGSWPADWKARGYSGERTYAKNGCLTLGIAGNPGNLTMPALDAIGDTPTEIVVEFDILEYKHASEKGKTIFSVAGAGQIVSLTGNYTGVANDDYTSPSADRQSYNFYCGDYTDWAAGALWHHIVVTVTGATRDTRLTLAGEGANCRFWIDNFKVSQKK